MKYYPKIVVASLAAVLALSATGKAENGNYDGTVKAGYVFFDSEGSKGVNQSTYNLYEGVDLSLERFSYRFDNGLNLTANIQSAALRNRNIAIGATQTGTWGVGFTHNGYRRSYDFNGDIETKRYRSNGQFWWRARPWAKMYGGVGVTKKNGNMLLLFEPETGDATNEVDYSRQSYHAGLTLQRNHRMAQVEFRQSNFDDNLVSQNDRSTIRFRASASADVPGYEHLILNGGYLLYRNAYEYRLDTLTAHTFWGGARFANRDGYLVRYSFIFDRARRTGDGTDADNITHAVYIGKNWHRRGGVTAGYRYRMNDDDADELTGNGYYVTAWLKPVSNFSFKAGYGSEEMDVDEGRTLTGITERSKGWGSARYTGEFGWVRVKAENRQSDNEDIGSSTDYFRLASDLSLELSDYGVLSGSYSYGNGEYVNSAGDFKYDEHVLNGDLTSKEYRNLTLGVGGTYLRSQRDLNVESSSVRFSGFYRLKNGLALEFEYSSHNFDNLDDPSPIYSEYYTDNIVRIGFSYDL